MTNNKELRIAVLQPPYPSGGRGKDAEECLSWCRNTTRQLAPGSVDLVALPEYCTVPGISDIDSGLRFLESTGAGFEGFLKAEAARIDAYIVFGTLHDGDRRTNRTVVVGPEGSEAIYDKTHLTGVEKERWGLSPGDGPVFIDIRGCRTTFAVCFEMYFPEYFAALAAGKPDLVIIPSYQRSEKGHRLRALSAVRALDTGTYVVRSSYAMPGGGRGGHSCVAAPDGTILHDLLDTPGVINAAVTAGQGYSKPASFGAPEVIHRDLMEENRRPELYRAETRKQVPAEKETLLVCAHRGLSSTCPENTLPAFGAALAAGADEIELDLWLSSDGAPVVCHDPDLRRTTDCEGTITELTWHEIREADAGVGTAAGWAGVRVPRYEEVVDFVADRAIQNIHIKDPGPDGMLVRKVAELLQKNGLERFSYIAGEEAVLEWATRICPHIERACLASQREMDHQLEVARRYSCRRIQFGRQVTKGAIDAAKGEGFICNLFWSDDLEDARAFVRLGIDVILTNRCHVISRSSLTATSIGR